MLWLHTRPNMTLPRRRLTDDGTVLLAVPRAALKVYSKLPSAVAVRLLPHKSPPVVAKSGEEWFFVEWDNDRRYRPLDVSSKPVAGKDPDVETCGDAPDTFLGAIVHVAAALLERGLSCRTLNVEAIEVEHGYTGRVRLLPVDSLYVPPNELECELSVRKMLLGLLTSLPGWVKEDPDGHYIALEQALDAKPRRGTDYVNTVASCLQRARELLTNDFSQEPRFSPRPLHMFLSDDAPPVSVFDFLNSPVAKPEAAVAAVAPLPATK
jgi:hypothetical protein